MKRINIWIAPSSSGKNYLLERYLKDNPKAERFITYTTRPIRTEANEKNHIDYHFITDDEFDVLKLTGRLIEERAYDTAEGLWRYGTTDFVNEWSNEYAGILDISGSEVVIKKYPDAEVVVTYVHCPADIRTKRAENRGNFKRSEWERRLKTDEEDFSEEKLADLNDVLRQYGTPPIQYVNNY
jgi:guanylate kinase